MLRYQPEIGAGLDTPARPLPVAAGRPDPARLRPAAAAAARRRRDRRRSRPRSLNPVRGAGQRRAERLDLAEPRAADPRAARRSPIPHPLFGPAIRRLGGRLGAGALLGDAVRLLRYGRGVDNTRLREELGYEPRLRRRRRDPRLRRAERRAGADRSEPASGLDRRARRSASRDERGRAARQRSRPRRSPTSCARCAAGSSPGSTRSRPPSRRRAPAGPAARGARAVSRRLRGEYHEDEWGFDEEFAEAVFPIFEFLYDRWWRVEAERRRATCPPTAGR